MSALDHFMADLVSVSRARMATPRSCPVEESTQANDATFPLFFHNTPTRTGSSDAFHKQERGTSKGNPTHGSESGQLVAVTPRSRGLRVFQVTNISAPSHDVGDYAAGATASAAPVLESMSHHQELNSREGQGIEQLDTPGTIHGETRIVFVRGEVVAYSWDALNGRWSQVGVVDGPLARAGPGGSAPPTRPYEELMKLPSSATSSIPDATSSLLVSKTSSQYPGAKLPYSPLVSQTNFEQRFAVPPLRSPRSPAQALSPPNLPATTRQLPPEHGQGQDQSRSASPWTGSSQWTELPESDELQQVADKRNLTAELDAVKGQVASMQCILKRQDKMMQRKGDESLTVKRVQSGPTTKPVERSIFPTTQDEFDLIQVVKDLRKMVKERDEQIRQNELALEERNKQISSLKQANADQNVAFEQLMGKARELMEEAQHLANELQKAQNDLAKSKMAWDSDKLELTEALMGKQQEILHLQNELQDLHVVQRKTRDEAAEIEVGHNARKNMIDDLMKDLKHLQSENDLLNDQKSRLSEEVKDLRYQIVSLQDEKLQHEEIVKRGQQEKQSLQDQHKLLLEELRKSEQQRAHLENERDGARQDAIKTDSQELMNSEMLKMKYDHREEDNQALQEEIDKMKVQSAYLREEERRISSELRVETSTNLKLKKEVIDLNNELHEAKEMNFCHQRTIEMIETKMVDLEQAVLQKSKLREEVQFLKLQVDEGEMQRQVLLSQVQTLKEELQNQTIAPEEHPVVFSKHLAHLHRAAPPCILDSTPHAPSPHAQRATLPSPSPSPSPSLMSSPSPHALRAKMQSAGKETREWQDEVVTLRSENKALRHDICALNEELNNQVMLIAQWRKKALASEDVREVGLSPQKEPLKARDTEKELLKARETLKASDVKAEKMQRAFECLLLEHNKLKMEKDNLDKAFQETNDDLKSQIELVATLQKEANRPGRLLTVETDLNMLRIAHKQLQEDYNSLKSIESVGDLRRSHEAVLASYADSRQANQMLQRRLEQSAEAQADLERQIAEVRADLEQQIAENQKTLGQQTSHNRMLQADLEQQAEVNRMLQRKLEDSAVVQTQFEREKKATGKQGLELVELKSRVEPMAQEVRIFLEDLSEMLAFIIQCGGEHGGLLDGLEQLSRNAEEERQARMRCEKDLDDMIQAATRKQADIESQVAEEIQKLRVERTLLEDELLEERNKMHSAHQRVQAEDLRAQEEAIAINNVEMEKLRAELRATHEESASLKGFLLMWDKHRDDADFKGYLEVGMTQWKDKIDQILYTNESLRTENRRMSDLLSDYRLKEDTEAIANNSKQYFLRNFGKSSAAYSDVDAPSEKRPPSHSTGMKSPRDYDGRSLKSMRSPRGAVALHPSAAVLSPRGKTTGTPQSRHPVVSRVDRLRVSDQTEDLVTNHIASIAKVQQRITSFKKETWEVVGMLSSVAEDMGTESTTEPEIAAKDFTITV